MKFSQRLSCVLCVFVLLSAVFSINANATDVEAKDFSVRIQTYCHSTTVNQSPYLLNIYPNNNENESQEYFFGNAIDVGDTYFEVRQNYYIEYTGDEPILKKGRKSTVKLNNVHISTLFKRLTNNRTFYDRDIESARVLITYSNGSSVYLDELNIEKPVVQLHNIDFTFTPDYDVTKIEYIFINRYDVKSGEYNDKPHEATVYAGEYSDTTLTLALEVQSEEASLLGGVIEWLKGIKQGITDLFDSIAQLPSKIWTFIEDGLKSLFIPSEEFIMTFKDDVNGILENKFGAVYEVVNIMFESWDTIQSFDEKNMIEFPKSTLTFKGSKFEFGGYEVKIVPQGMELLVGIVKIIIGITCTLYFINGLRKRYDEIMR